MLHPRAPFGKSKIQGRNSARGDAASHRASFCAVRARCTRAAANFPGGDFWGGALQKR